ncbi:hypothetical protein ACP0HG_26105, partial [Escherichia coli]
VATDLKSKRVDEESRSLPMGAFQRGLYVSAIEAFRRQSAGAPGRHLALLHRLRLLCSDPGDGGAETLEPIEIYRSRSPKLDWLIDTLD